MVHAAAILISQCRLSVSRGGDSGVILQGRPHEGCLILYRSTMGNKVRFIKTYSKRMCSVYILTLLMYVCIYFILI